MSPMFEDAVASFAGSSQYAEFYKVNIEEEKEIASEAQITALPTFAVYKDGFKLGAMATGKPVKMKAFLDWQTLALEGYLKRVGNAKDS
ncbi:hypothetical protein BT69DRAFT_1285101 [Atractiella rhizophila]|nr:hypothetical protein BT69DRAFT_1285101 [Atractiella rhizophila]